MLVLFLNELSTDSVALTQETARERVLCLLKVLKGIRKLQQVALNSQQPLANTLVDARYTLSELLAGNEYKDEWRFLRGFANRSPFAADMDAAFSLQVQEVEYLYQGQTAIGIGWVDQLDTALVSFPLEQFCELPFLSVLRQELDEEAEIQEVSVEVRHFVQPAHITVHSHWLQGYLFETLPSAGELWQQREMLFPHLRFLVRTEDDMAKLGVSGAAYHLVVQRLRELNQDIARWIETTAEWPEFSSKASPEGATRKQLCKVMDNDVVHDFDWHLRFTGGIAGRVHFRICTQDKKAIIAYMGQKLDKPIVQ